MSERSEIVVAQRPILVYYREVSMNRKFVAAFAAVCFAAALGSAASVVYRVLDGDAAGRRAAKADFEGLRSVLAYVKSPSDLADQSLRTRLASRYEASPNLLLIDVYERGEGDRWRIPADSPYLPGTRAASAGPEPLYPLASTILLSSPLKGDSSGKLAVDALYTSLPQILAFSAFRDALIALAAFLALAAMVLAIVSALSEDSARSAGNRNLAPAVAGSSQSAAFEAAAAAAEFQYDTFFPEEGAGEDTPAPAKTTEPQERGTLPRLDGDFDIPVMAESSGDSRPEGLYSPASGLGWESYLKERLDAEISRSASFEQDLSLLVISHEGLTSSDRNFAAMGAAIEKFFSFRDLAFERGEDGFSIVLPNTDSSHALRMAEEFFKKLVFLADGDFAELDLLPLFMGISSRSGRLVDAMRMIEEAGAALEKASFEKDTHIVAFRPDPDKYRIFLAAKGA
jgi:GGDEF domain-containing protein